MIKFRETQIKVWVLTGDQLETAVHLALSAGLLIPLEKRMIKLSRDHGDFGDQRLIKKLEKAHLKYLDDSPTLLAVDGESFDIIMKSYSLQQKFVHLCQNSDLVIFSLLNPLQKHQVCTLARKSMNSRILSIGDGQNDTPML